MRRIYPVFLSVFLLLGCGLGSLAGGPPAQSPEEAATAFMSALAERRLGDVEASLTPGYQQQLTANCQSSDLTACSRELHQKLGQLNYQVQSSRLDGDRAAVTVRAWREKQPAIVCMSLSLAQQGNNWVISGQQAWACQ